MGNKAETAKKTETARTKKTPAAKKTKSAAVAKVSKPAAVKPKTASKPVAKDAKKKTTPPAISSEEIELRAYYISEKRRQQGVHGDSAHDWLEAERQLTLELKSK